MDEQRTAGMLAEFQDDFLVCWRRLPNKGFFFALLAAWLALFHFLGNSIFGYIDTPSLFGWMNYAYADPLFEDGHGKWIPIVVLALFWWKRKELLAQPLREWWPALGILAVAAVLHLVGYLAQQPQISIVGLFTGIYGLMGLAWGRRWLRASFFPFFLFAFCVPLRSFAETITFPLRLLVTWISVGISQGLGIGVVRDGSLIFDSQHSFCYDVAPACSGIRSLVAIGAIAMIYAFTSFQTSWKRAILIALALPLSVAGNTFRMLAIVVAAELYGRDAGMQVHESAFWSLLPYIPAILGLILIGRWFEKRLPDRLPAAGTPLQQPTAL